MSIADEFAACGGNERSFTNQGVFAARSSNYSNWLRVGTNLPNVPVWDMDYDDYGCTPEECTEQIYFTSVFYPELIDWYEEQAAAWRESKAKGGA